MTHEGEKLIISVTPVIKTFTFSTALNRVVCLGRNLILMLMLFQFCLEKVDMTLLYVDNMSSDSRHDWRDKERSIADRNSNLINGN